MGNKGCYVIKLYLLNQTSSVKFSAISLKLCANNISTMVQVQWKPIRAKFVKTLNSLQRGCPMAPKIGGVGDHFASNQNLLIC